MSISVLIPAAGKGQRMGCHQNKLLLPLGGIPVIIHTLRIFQNISSINRIIMAVNADMIRIFEKLCVDHGITALHRIMEGGEERQDSVRIMVQAAGESDRVAIHDGARPFLSDTQLEAVLSIPEGYDGTVLGIPLRDTLKRVDEEGCIIGTPDRRAFWLAQTPQVFHYGVLREATERACLESLRVTDDAAMVEYYGGRVKMIEGSVRNIKITTPEDLAMGEALLTIPASGRDNG